MHNGVDNPVKLEFWFGGHRIAAVEQGIRDSMQFAVESTVLESGDGLSAG